LEVLDEEISGLLYKEGNKGVIIVNKEHSLTRQRFTGAHELAHLVLNHRGKVFVDKGSIIFRDLTSSTGQVEEEKQANSLAAALLMPDKFLQKDLKGRPLREPELIEKLARKYKVSPEAMTYRLSNLGWIS